MHRHTAWVQGGAQDEMRRQAWVEGGARDKMRQHVLAGTWADKVQRTHDRPGPAASWPPPAADLNTQLGWCNVAARLSHCLVQGTTTPLPPHLPLQPPAPTCSCSMELLLRVVGSCHLRLRCAMLRNESRSNGCSPLASTNRAGTCRTEAGELW